MEMNYEILPIDNRSPREGYALFTKFYLSENETGNCFQSSAKENDWFVASVKDSKHGDEVVDGRLASFLSFEDAENYILSLK